LTATSVKVFNSETERFVFRPEICSFYFRPAEYEIPVLEAEVEPTDEKAKTEPADVQQSPPQQQQPRQQQHKPVEPFAQCVDPRNPKGWLVDLLNRFGVCGGFDRLHERFRDTNGLTVPLIHALVRPFGQCHALLTQRTLKNYLMPIVEAVPAFLESLSDDDLKKEVKSESKNDSLSAIVKSLKCMAASVPGQVSMT
jgi:hypothetical protein